MKKMVFEQEFYLLKFLKGYKIVNRLNELQGKVGIKRSLASDG